MVTCEKRRPIRVSIVVRGVSMTALRSRIEDGTGRFSDVHRISDVLGSFVEGDARAGAVDSGGIA